ncbi:MAG: hypothetical protein M1489_06865 [Firmicutes bacterium]|nr:hypothetical protein [Bacillota bacterium]
MLKRLSAIAAVFFLLTAFLTPAYAGLSFDATTAIEDAVINSGYSNTSKSGDSINYITSTGLSNITDANGNRYGFLTYGQPHGGPRRNGQQRYIGYTYYGEDYTNMDYPADKNANGTDFASQHWIPQPWDDGAVKANNENISMFKPEGKPGDGSPEYHTVILAGIMAYGATNANNGYTIGETADGSFYGNIEQYVHILAPPTKYAWGIGRMWHIENGQLWYVTIPIAPEALLPAAPDLSTNLETNSFTGAKPGDKITSTVAYRLNPDHPRPERALLRLHHVVDGQEYPVQLQPVNGAPVPDEKGYITLQPGDVKVYSYIFTVQDGPSKILSRVNPVDTQEDKNWDNNCAEATVIPQSYDIKIKLQSDQSIYTSIDGDPTPVLLTATVTRKDDIPGEIDVTGSIKDGFPIDLKLAPGESKKVEYGYPARPGKYTINAEAWPVGTSDIYPPDNRDSITITAKNESFNLDPTIRSGTLR